MAGGRRWREARSTAGLAGGGRSAGEGGDGELGIEHGEGGGRAGAAGVEGRRRCGEEIREEVERKKRKKGKGKRKRTRMQIPGACLQGGRTVPRKRKVRGGRLQNTGGGKGKLPGETLGFGV